MAVERRRTFLEYQEEVNRFANDLISGLRKYLDSPNGTIMCREVDRQHDVVGQPSPVVDACFCFDTFWYFQLTFDFPSGPKPAPGMPSAYHASVLVGVKKRGSEWLVALPDNEFRVTSEEDKGQFYQHIFDSMKEMLGKSWTEPQNKKFGFVVPKS